MVRDYPLCHHKSKPNAQPLEMPRQGLGEGRRDCGLSQSLHSHHPDIRMRKVEMSSLPSSLGTRPRRIDVSSPHLEDRRWDSLGPQDSPELPAA